MFCAVDGECLRFFLSQNSEVNNFIDNNITGNEERHRKHIQVQSGVWRVFVVLGNVRKNLKVNIALLQPKPEVTLIMAEYSTDSLIRIL